VTEPTPILGISLLPEVDGAQGPAAAHAPRSATEQAVVDIWRQVLPAQAVSPDSDFFDLGGDSLLATQIVARVRQVFGIGLDLRELLDAPTPAAMAVLVEAALIGGLSPAGGPAAPTVAPIVPIERGQPLPLSFTQERMWFIQQMDPLSAAYNIAAAVRLHGAFDLPALEAALSELVRRHESLRTTFVLGDDGQPRQCPAAPEPFHVRVVEVSDPAGAYALAAAEAHEPYDLARGPLLRASAYRISPDDQVLLLGMHHIISDAWSMGVMGRAVIALYEAARRGTTAGLPELPIQYADFAAWQRATLTGPTLERELDYWRQKLAGVAVLELPLDRPRPSVQTYHGALEGADLDLAVLKQLRRLSQQASATLSMTLLAAFQVLLQRYTGQDDVAVGLPIANRREVAVEGLIGAFVNTLILRTDLSGSPTFREALARARQSSLEAYAHQDMPFAQLVAELNPERSLSRTPLVQVMFNHINVPLPTARMSDVKSEYLELDRGAAQFDLTLTVFDPGQSGERERLILEYNTDLFEPATARRLLRHYAHLLRAIAADPNQPTRTLPLLDDAERRELLVDWNDNARPYPSASLAELFEAQAAAVPNAPALIFGEAQLSYGALNQRANQIAHYLQSLGIGPGAVVGVCLERSFDQIAAVLAALKTGAAYLPLDPAYPAERLSDMVEDSGAAVVVGTRDLTPLPPSLKGKGVPALAARLHGPPSPPTPSPEAKEASGEGPANNLGESLPLPPAGEGGRGDPAPGVLGRCDASAGATRSGEGELPSPNNPLVFTSLLPPSIKGRGAGGVRSPRPLIISLNDLTDQLSGQSTANLGVPSELDAPAYMIYTSGSTGRPKGVVAPQRGTVNHCQWVWDTYPFAPGEVACQKTSLSFVDSLVEIFGPLLRGVPLVLLPEAVVKDPARLVDELARHGVTRLMLLPSLLRAMLTVAPNLGQRLPRLRLWAAGSEILDAALADEFLAAAPGAVLLNLCGASEDSGDVTCFDCRQPRPAGVVPIGRPLANTQVYVLDPATLQPAPIGVAGEIYAGGAGLALGYHNRPELNAERFVPNPFSSQPGARLYRTGDLGRWLPDGNLLYLGRRDRQVKVRGVRIELDEVQAVLALHPAVADCVVQARQRDSAAGLELAAYYVARPGATPAPGELRRHLAGRLPESMLPAWIVALPALPQLPNGKLDLAALPDPNPDDTRAHAYAGELVAPQTRLETNLAELWAESLGLPQVGVTDNFFELGGHSLLAASLFARIKATLGLDLPLTLLFRQPTIAGLAAAIVQDGQAPAGLSSLVPLKPKGNRPPLFCVHPLGGGVADYAAVAKHLSPQQPFYGLRAKGLDDERYQALSFEALAADYVAEIRAFQPYGPYRLGGYSSGGLIAFEMARQLAAAGQAVALVALLDSYAPSAPGQARLRPAALRNLAASLPHWLRDLSRLERRQILARVRRRRLAAQHGAATLTAGDYLGEAELAELPARHRAFVDAHWQALAAYQPQAYAGRVTLFRAQAQALSRAGDPDKGWGALALGGVDIRQFPGSHRTLLSEPWVAGLARVMQTKLDELENESLVSGNW
jgi:amino acid adenylation domain-containing protein